MVYVVDCDLFEFWFEFVWCEYVFSVIVLQMVGEMFNWGQGDCVLGVVFIYLFGLLVVQVIEVVDDNGWICLKNVWIVVDVGVVFDLGNIEVQLVGGCIFGLFVVVIGKIMFVDGEVEQINFFDYDVLCMGLFFVFDVQILQNVDYIGGVGEIGILFVVLVFGNVLFVLIGKWV